MSVPPPVPVRERRPLVEAAETLPPSPPTHANEDPSVLERTYWVRFWEYANGEEGAGVLLSFVMHVLMLAVLAIPVYRSLTETEVFTTVVQKKAEDQVLIAQPVNTEVVLETPASKGGETLKTPVMEIPKIAPTLLPNLDPSDLPSLAGDDGGEGSDTASGKGEFRIAEPPNAVRAGNFSVWPWPILPGKDTQGQRLHGEPGGSPQTFQPYHIVIRLKVPAGKRRVKLSDFSGQIVGSDSYFQKIPVDAWFYDHDGDLVRGTASRSIPVIEGTAELLIYVPGAGKPSVRDTITVSSRIMDEEQTILLDFQPRTKE